MEIGLRPGDDNYEWLAGLDQCIAKARVVTTTALARTVTKNLIRGSCTCRSCRRRTMIVYREVVTERFELRGFAKQRKSGWK
jgi:hypothetical protein